MGPGQKWVTDVTEFNVNGQKLYLSPVLELYNGEIVAYETSKRPVFNLVSAMFKKFFRPISPEQKHMLNSDQGWQYQQPVYRRKLDQHGITQTMYPTANCLHNTAIQSLFGPLKAQIVSFHSLD